MEKQYNTEVINHGVSYKGYKGLFEWEEGRGWFGYLEAANEVQFESTTYEGVIYQFKEKVDML